MISQSCAARHDAAYAPAAGVLEQLSGWPPQVAGDPDELPVRGAS